METQDIYKQHIELKITHKSTIRRYTSEISALKKKIAELEEKIRNPFTPTIHDASLEHLLSIVANVTGELPENIIGKKRNREYIIARHLFWYVGKIHLRYKLVSLGLYCNVHHSTVVHAIKMIGDAIDMNFYPENGYYTEIMSKLETYTKLYNSPATRQTADSCVV